MGLNSAASVVYVDLSFNKASTLASKSNKFITAVPFLLFPSNMKMSFFYDFFQNLFFFLR